MTILDAKAIPIDEFLATLGHHPVKTASGCKWYSRPYGHENHPSLKLSPDNRAWFDHGTGKGGNIIDLARLLGDCADVAQTLAYIQHVTGKTAYTSPTTPHSLPLRTEFAYTLQAHRTMADRRGENWCHTRALDVEACRPYLLDIYFNRAPKPLPNPLYGVGLPNIAGGFEIRTPLQGRTWLKSAIAPKSITVFEAQRQNAPWYLFEGLPDFGTFLSVRRPPVGHLNFMITNGTGMTTHALAYLTTQPAGCLYLCPQHGSPGNRISFATIRQLAADRGWNAGEIDYPRDCSDYNEWHMREKGNPPVSTNPAGGPRLRTTPKLGE